MKKKHAVRTLCAILAVGVMITLTSARAHAVSDGEEKQRTEYRIQERLSLYDTWLYWRSLSRTPFYADTHKAYYLTDLTVGAKLPWNRIFEVDLNVHTKVSSEPAA